jgi:integrase
MAVRKIRNTWYVDIRFDDKRYRLRSPENTRIGAQAFEAVLRQKLARGEVIGKAPEIEQNLLFEQFAWHWFEQYVIPNNKYSEQYAKQKILASNLVPFFGKMPLRGINSGHIERFKARQVSEGVSNKTINNRLAVLGKCLRCAYEWHRIEMPSIKKLRCPLPKTDYLTVAECDQLLSSTDGQMLEMLFLALRTGMRQGEIRGLQWSSIDWQNRSIAVRHSRCDRNRSLVSPKSNRERHIPLDADLYEMLFKRKRESGYVFTNLTRNNEPYTSHHLLERLEPFCARAGLRKITWHSLRHTFATQLILRGVPLTVVKELLGHSTITTTMRYSHVAPSALRSAIELLNPRNAHIADLGQQVGNQWQQAINSRL